jgi:hypothetical protein
MGSAGVETSSPNIGCNVDALPASIWRVPVGMLTTKQDLGTVNNLVVGTSDTSTTLV